MIELINVQKAYKDLVVLKSIDLKIVAGEVVSIRGASGAGKSTLLHIMGTLDKADDGKLFFDNKDISYSTNLELAALRNQKMGFIFQFHHLLPEFTALENVCLPAMISGKRISEVEARAIKLLDILGIDDRSHHRPNQLSGGEQQRVAVARSLINEPDVIFADEPSGNLDTQNAQDLHQLFLTLRDEFGQTFVIVTHNDTLAEMSDKQYHIRDGIIAIN